MKVTQERGGTRSLKGSSANCSCLEQPIPADESLATKGEGDEIFEKETDMSKIAQSTIY